MTRPATPNQTPDHFIDIYTHRAAEYERMIAAEDVDGNLPAALQSLTDLSSQRFLDLGTGTGRLPRLLDGICAQIVGVDLHRAMLAQNSAIRKAASGSWQLVQADMRRLPFPPAWAGVVAAGWSIGHLCAWYPRDWKAQVGRVLDEMHRLAIPGGWLVILETLGTGALEPAPPGPKLAGYYIWLEAGWGFQRRAFRTDYQFASPTEAAELTGFFFGPELAARIREQAWARLPEWTGMWVKQN